MTPYTTTALRIPVLTSRGASHRMVAARFRNLHTSRRTFEPPPFRPPPIRERLRPLIPFFIWWSIITSLTVHLLRARQSSKEMQSRSEAKISVLESLLGRTRAGEALTEEEVERQLEMVGLRERRTGDLGEKREDIRDVGWMEAIFGRKGRDQVVDKTAKEDEEDVAAWAKSVVTEASRADSSRSQITPPDPANTSTPSSRPGASSPSGPTPSMVRRAPSSNAYMS